MISKFKFEDDKSLVCSAIVNGISVRKCRKYFKENEYFEYEELTCSEVLDKLNSLDSDSLSKNVSISGCCLSGDIDIAYNVVYLHPVISKEDILTGNTLLKKLSSAIDEDSSVKDRYLCMITELGLYDWSASTLNNLRVSDNELDMDLVFKSRDLPSGFKKVVKEMEG